ncbi:YggS family pyridoxal phosphate-dependent enzyme [Methylophaga sp. OBS3]|uniref:YggS family pyridoxal phosphate-dependent enzyme n=1 Tax=Methylophaga sp. OBS3 TaxID=2991934 RepID=UPI00224EE031|nr:YggS family pyridoxal phosphate-dependent enzyme [Methylophaga sp. OBS3]MCX4190495.1 YggS family pyridoxal phosphate-dependent enzyme [Methylophaga sp. OBS3]
MTEIKNHLQAVLQQIHAAENAANRPENSVNLLAVSKTWPADRLRELALSGQQDFGENYLQEALEKIHALADLSLTWHFIGPIQSNKTRDIAANFAWVQSVDRQKIAQRLNDQRPDGLPALNICLQVNIDNEDTKSGLTVDELPALAQQVNEMPNLCLRGLMVIPTATDDIDQQHDAFKRSFALFRELKNTYPTVDTLSMGMSGDLTAAIAEGSNMVRIGTALFGKRHTQA